MKMKWWFGAALLTVAVALVATGCSKKDSGTSSTPLTPEEQFATFEQMTGGIDSLGSKTLPLISSSAGNMFWDGVQPWDQPDFGMGFLSLINLGGLGGFSRPGLDGLMPGALGKRSVGGHGFIESRINQVLSAAATQSGAYEYDATRGWWIAVLDTSIAFDADTLGTAMHLGIAVSLRDSVRFDNSVSGTPSEQPTELTNRLRHGSRTNLSIGLTIVSGDSVNVNLKRCDLTSAGSNTLTGLNAAQVSLTGQSNFGGNIDISATVPDTLPGPNKITTTAKGTLGLTSAASGVTMDNSPNPCPTAGTVNAGLSVDLTSSQNGQNHSAKGSWDMTINFTGGGAANVEVQSGTFTRSAGGQVCTPPM